jgi:hypothetical protein
MSIGGYLLNGLLANNKFNFSLPRYCKDRLVTRHNNARANEAGHQAFFPPLNASSATCEDPAFDRPISPQHPAERQVLANQP